MSQEQTKIDNETVFACIEKLKVVICSQNTQALAFECQELIKVLSVANEWYKHCFQARIGSEIRDALDTALKALELTLTVLQFCKHVDIDHHWVFSQYSNHFGSIFKAIMNNLKFCLETLDHFGRSEDHLSKVLVLLRDLCSVVLHFDTTLLVHSWKHTCKMLQKYQAATCATVAGGDGSDDPSVAEYVQDLCSAILEVFANCVRSSSAPPPDLQRTVKGCKQLLACLMTLIRGLDDSEGVTVACYKLLLGLISAAPPCLGVPAVQDGPLQTIRSSLLCVCEPLLTILLERRGFAKVALDRNVVPSGQGYAWCICLMKILLLFGRIPSVVQEYDFLESESNEETCERQCALLDSVFDCVRLCHVELSLPLPAAASGAPLYQHVCTTLSAFVVQLPARYFRKLERVLMRQLLREEPYCSLLASDVLSFVLRWGSADLCKQFAFLLASLALALPQRTTASHHVCQVTSRAVTFMSNDHRSDFIEAFPPTNPDHLKLWSSISLRQFGNKHLKQLCSSLVVLSSKCIEQALAGTEAAYQTLHCSLEALSRVFSLEKCKEFVSDCHFSKGMTLLLQLWEWSLLLADTSHRMESQLIVCSMIQTTALVLGRLTPSDVVKVLSISSHFAHCKCVPVGIPVAIGDLLEASGSMTMSDPKALLDRFSCLVVNLFHALLTSANWLVRQRTLEAYVHFAKSTPYSELAQACIPPDLGSFVVEFLSKKLTLGSFTADDVEIKAVAQRLKLRSDATEQRESTRLQSQEEEGVVIDDSEGFVDLTADEHCSQKIDTEVNKRAIEGDNGRVMMEDDRVMVEDDRVMMEDDRVMMEDDRGMMEDDRGMMEDDRRKVDSAGRDGLQLMVEGWGRLKRTSGGWQCSVVTGLRELCADITNELEGHEEVLL